MIRPPAILPTPDAPAQNQILDLCAAPGADPGMGGRVANSEGAFELMQNALRRADYPAVIGAAQDISVLKLSSERLNLYMDALLAAAAGLSDGSDAELSAYDLVIEAAEGLPEGDVFEPQIHLKVNSALFNKGVALAQLDRSEEAIAVYDELVRRAGTMPGLHEGAVRALFNKGASLGELNRQEEAIAVYDELVGRFSDADDLAVLVAVSKALINKGIALAELNRLAESIAVLDDVVTRWGDSPDPLLRERAARALLNKASALAHLRHREMALKTYAELLHRFESDRDPTVQEHVELARETREILRQNLN